MTAIRIDLPDALAREAERAGLLTSKRLERLLRAELRQARVADLFEAMDKLTAPKLTPEEVAAEIAEMRKERNH